MRMEILELQKSIQFVKGIGPYKAALLAKLGIFTVQDIVEYYPRRYEDRSQIRKISQLENAELQTITGRIVGSEELKPRRGLVITKLAVADDTGLVFGVWFNQPYIKKQWKPGTQVVLSGRVERRNREVQLLDPEIESLEQEDLIHAARIVPIYSLTENISQRVFRTITRQVINQVVNIIPEPLPEYLRHKHGLLDKVWAVENIHFPTDDISLQQAKRRLVYEEFFILQIGLLLLKQYNQTAEAGVIHQGDGELSRKFMEGLPFQFTTDQRRVLQEIKGDMEASKVMNRLLQGDVGSGKTVVAAAALVKTVENGYQGALMAPTEILAEQHYCSLTSLLEPLGIQVLLLTGGQPKGIKERGLAAIESGEAQVIVGTHALIQSQVSFAKLGLVVTDEQHRFGVRQRALLQEKGQRPDVLVMTATPIPRTLALTLYGDLDSSTIRELPPGRQPVETYVVSSKYRQRIYNFMRKLVTEGRQVYVVCPLIEESDKLQVQAAQQMADQLINKEFPDLAVGLLHGKMKNADKESVMAQFIRNELNILVATTVIEVGVNVPNASLMVIEGAERFGLAQLHQLRGRVGRGEHKSYCILVSDHQANESTKRLNLLKEIADGFNLAEQDLVLRGPGEFFGIRQHGLPDLKIADLLQDYEVLEIAKRDAEELILSKSPLADVLKATLKERFSGDSQLIFIS